MAICPGNTVAIDSCAVAHPLVEELLVEGRFGSATEVVPAWVEKLLAVT